MVELHSLVAAVFAAERASAVAYVAHASIVGMVCGPGVWVVAPGSCSSLRNLLPSQLIGY